MWFGLHNEIKNMHKLHLTRSIFHMRKGWGIWVNIILKHACIIACITSMITRSLWGNTRVASSEQSCYTICHAKVATPVFPVLQPLLMIAHVNLPCTEVQWFAKTFLWSHPSKVLVVFIFGIILYINWPMGLPYDMRFIFLQSLHLVSNLFSITGRLHDFLNVHFACNLYPAGYGSSWTIVTSLTHAMLLSKRRR